MQRHKHHASNPEILTPKICATAVPCPSEPSVPRLSNPNSARLPPRTVAAMLMAAVVALANSMLGRGRNLCAGDGRDGGTVTQRPDVAFVIFQLQAGIDEQLALFLGAIEILDYRRKCRWHSGDQRLARDLGAGLQDRSFRRGRLQPFIENNFDAAFPQNPLGKNGQRLRHLRQNAIAGLNDHAAMRFVAQTKVIPLDGMHEGRSTRPSLRRPRSRLPRRQTSGAVGAVPGSPRHPLPRERELWLRSARPIFRTSAWWLASIHCWLTSGAETSGASGRHGKGIGQDRQRSGAAHPQADRPG